MFAPLPQLLRIADAVGVRFRLYGRAIEVSCAEQLSPELDEILQDRFDELYAHLGGTALEGPPIELLTTLGVELVTPATVAEAHAALAAIEADSDSNTPAELNHRPGLIGLDIETAALPGTEQRPPVKLRKDGMPAKRQPPLNSDAAIDPSRSRVRLAQLYGGGRRCLVLDTDKLPLALLAPVLQRRTAIIHNAGFELRHLAASGIAIPQFEDTMQAAGLLLGVHRRGLDDAALTYLGIELPKGLQRSDWASPYLSQGQLSYAALDAIVVFRLWLKLRLELLSKGRGEAYLLQRDVTPAVTRMAARGILLDRQRHAEQVVAWSTALAQARDEFVKDAKRQPLDTPNQVRAYLQEVLPDTLLTSWPRTERGQMSIRAAQLRRVAHLPVIRSLLAISAMEKLLSAFGPELADKISSQSGRLHPSYNIASAKTGRFSSNSPNVQQLPKHRAPEFRGCIVAGPGMILVIGDFNMMELRAAAAISGDPAMTADFANGVDLHTQQAAAMLGVAYEAVDATARDRAKPVNFSMIYGAGAAGLVATAWNNYGVVLSLAEAEAARQSFLRRYAGYADWMRLNYVQCTQRGVIQIGCSGRVIEAAWESPGKGVVKTRHGAFWPDEDEDDNGTEDDEAPVAANGGWAQDLLKYTLCCNAPVQGICADASMLALLKCDAALRAAHVDGGPILFVHDEIVLEVKQEDAERACRMLTDAMVSAFAEIFPGAPLKGVVSTRISASWAAEKS